MINIIELRNIMKEFKPGAQLFIKFVNDEEIELTWVVVEERTVLSLILDDDDFKNIKELRELVGKVWTRENARVH